MSVPVAKTSGFALTGGTEQTILGGVGALVRIQDDGYLLIRNTGGSSSLFFVYTSSDGVNFQPIPDPYFGSDGIPAHTSPQPFPLPSPRYRGEYIRVTGNCAGSTTADVEIYSVDIKLRAGATHKPGYP